VGELISLLQFAPNPSPGSFSVKKPKQRVENGKEITCMQVKGDEDREKPREFCIDSGSHDILTVDWKEPPDELRREQFADYLEFDAHRYPRKLELIVNGSKVVSATVDELLVAALDDRLLVPPQGAIERRQCAGMKHAVPVSTPDPMYPKSASQNNIGGDTIVAMTVLTDGSVTDIQLVGTSARSLDEASLNTLRKWKFKPAMCGAEPVVSDIHVVVSFRMD
jgi:TonB family protein